MAILTLEVGALAANCYIVSSDAEHHDEKPCVVIDPGDEHQRITGEVRRAGLHVEAIFLTHSHADHIGGVPGMLRDWPKAVLACSAETSRRAGDPALNLSKYIDAPVTCGPAGRILNDGERFSAAWMDWRAAVIPGHEPCEMVYILDKGLDVFTGDTVFAGSVGRSDFPGGDGPALIRSVRKLLESLPPDAVLYPGHGPATEAQHELRYNPFLAMHCQRSV